MKLSRKSIIIGGGAVAAVFIGYGLIQSFFPDKTKYDFVMAERQTIIQEVSVTGRVKPAESVDLAFERSGRVTSVGAIVGDKVKTGQVLLILDRRQLSAEVSRAAANVEGTKASLRQYEAAVIREEANLEELKRGNRPEEIFLAEIKVSNAERALQDARTNVDQTTNKVAIDLVNVYEGIKDVLRDAYTKADDAINRQIDAIFINETTSPQLSFNLIHPQLKTEVEWQRSLVYTELEQLKSLLVSQSLSLSSLEDALESGSKHLLVIRDFLQKVNEVVKDASDLSAASVDSYRTSVTLGLSNVNTVLATANSHHQKLATQRVIGQNNITAAEAKVNDAKNILEAAQAELALKRAPAGVEEIAAQNAVLKQAQANLASQQARVREAKAAVESLQAQLAENSLLAPFSGTVTRQEAKLGEIVSPGVVLVSIISEAKYEIEANVPEIDVSKIQVGNPATTTLDAYGNDVIFSASVITIDPAETIIEGVSTYKVKLQFGQDDERIKSGMTANITILAQKRADVLAVPQRAVIDKDGKKIIRLLRGEGRQQKIEEVVVKVGLRGSDGNVEIIEGVSEGDRVVVGEKK